MAGCVAQVPTLPGPRWRWRSRSTEAPSTVSHPWAGTHPRRRFPVVTPDDTDPTVRRLQIERLRGMTMEQRLAITEELTAVAVQLSREAIAAQMPGASKGDIMLRWIELVYGKELADRIAPLKHRLGVPNAP